MSTRQDEGDVSIAFIDGLVSLIADMIGVDPTRLKHRRTIDRARPYRHAIWFILSSDHEVSQRWMAEYWGVSRNTIKDGVHKCRTPDAAHLSALTMVRATLRRAETGV